MSASLSVCFSVVVSVGLSVGAGAGVASVGLSLLPVRCSVGVGKNSREFFFLCRSLFLGFYDVYDVSYSLFFG